MNNVLLNPKTSIYGIIVAAICAIVRLIFKIEIPDGLEVAFATIAVVAYYIIAHQVESWKILLTAVVGAIAFILQYFFKVEFSADSQVKLIDIFIVFSGLLGLNLKDKPKTDNTGSGTSIPAT